MDPLEFSSIRIDCTIGNYQQKLGYQKVVIVPTVRTDLSAASSNVLGLIRQVVVPSVYAYIDYVDGRTINMVVRNEMVISGLNFIQNSFQLQYLWNSLLNGKTFSNLDGYTQQAILNSQFSVNLFSPFNLDAITWLTNMIS